MEEKDLKLLKELLEKYKDHIYLNMPRDNVSRTKLENVKIYGDSILLHSRGYCINHEE